MPKKNKEFISDFMKEGLQEIGVSVKEYQAMDKKEKYQLKKYLEELGHC